MLFGIIYNVTVVRDFTRRQGFIAVGSTIIFNFVVILILYERKCYSVSTETIPVTSALNRLQYTVMNLAQHWTWFHFSELKNFGYCVKQANLEYYFRPQNLCFFIDFLSGWQWERFGANSILMWCEEKDLEECVSYEGNLVLGNEIVICS